MGTYEDLFSPDLSSSSSDRTCTGWPDVHSPAAACSHRNRSAGAGVITWDFLYIFIKIKIHENKIENMCDLPDDKMRQIC